MTKSLLRTIVQRFRRLRARAYGAHLARTTKLGAAVNFWRGFGNQQQGTIRVGRDCELSVGVVLHAYGGAIVLHDRVFLGPYAVVYGHGSVEIGEDTLISMHCRILSSNHSVPVVEHRIRSEPDRLQPTKIGADVWLGAGVTVLGGVTVGDGCVVGAGAVVTRDLAPYSIAMGVPARVTGKRSAKADAPPSVEC